MAEAVNLGAWWVMEFMVPYFAVLEDYPGDLNAYSLVQRLAGSIECMDAVGAWH